MSVNKAILLGNLGKDPEVKYTQQQMAICRFPIATSSRRKDQSGQWVDQTEWHNIVTFGKNAENCARFLKKGSQVFVDGEIRTNKWQDKEGRDRYTTEIIANSVQFIGKKGESSGSDYGSDAPNDSILAGIPSADSIASRPSSHTPAMDEPVTFADDDIPF
jgi:single-strand DNA-binding protein